MQLHDMVTVSIYIYIYIYNVACSNLVFTVSPFINISSINELSYRRSNTSFECVNVKC